MIQQHTIDDTLLEVRHLKRSLTISDVKAAQSHAASIVQNIFEAGPLGIDLDGTITEYPEFYRILTTIWPGNVYIITYRLDATIAREELRRLGIPSRAEVILSPSHQGKAEIIIRLGIKVYIDDQDEVINNIPESVHVLKVRNGGNFENKKWLYDSTTGRHI